MVLMNSASTAIDGIAYFAIAIFIFSHLSDIIYLAKVLWKVWI